MHTGSKIPNSSDLLRKWFGEENIRNLNCDSHRKLNSLCWLNHALVFILLTEHFWCLFNFCYSFSSVTNSRTTQIYHPTETTVAGQGTTFLEKTYVTTKANVTVQAKVTTKAYITTTANVTTQTTAKSTESTVKSILDFMPACPPLDNLPQLCNVSLGTITCNERAIIVKLCYHKYTTIYSNSSWGVCVSSNDRCEDIVSFVDNENLISKDAIPTTSLAYSSADSSAPSEESHTEEVTQYPPVIMTEDSKSFLRDNISPEQFSTGELWFVNFFSWRLGG